MVHQKVKCRHAKRRHQDMVKLLQRKALMHSLGQQGGMVYEKHIKKINQSLGYMRDGNVTHFVQAGFRQKTRDRSRCGPVVRYSPHDQRAADETWQQLRDRMIRTYGAENLEFVEEDTAYSQ